MFRGVMLYSNLKHRLLLCASIDKYNTYMLLNKQILTVYHILLLTIINLYILC